MRESHLDPRNTSRSRSSRPEAQHSKIDPVELAAWLEDHGERLTRRWLVGVVNRHEDLNEDVRDLLTDFLTLFGRFLPAFLGPYRTQIEPLWTQAAELYGSVAAMRGLAAGEVIEEFQILREEIIRLFYHVPPVRDLDRLALRDVLRVNRIVDLGVTYASVGHTDALFFALFQGSGVATSLSDEQSAEVRAQMHSIDQELTRVLNLLAVS